MTLTTQADIKDLNYADSGEPVGFQFNVCKAIK